MLPNFYLAKAVGPQNGGDPLPTQQADPAICHRDVSCKLHSKQQLKALTSHERQARDQ